MHQQTLHSKYTKGNKEPVRTQSNNIHAQIADLIEQKGCELCNVDMLTCDEAMKSK